MPHILQYISEHWAPPPEVKTENGHAHQEGDAPLPQTAQLLAAIVTVLLQHGRLRCAAIKPGAVGCLIYTVSSGYVQSGSPLSVCPGHRSEWNQVRQSCPNLGAMVPCAPAGRRRR
jgi:hypothetical protein